MAYLILGLVLFLGVHSVRIVADGWRTQTVARIGANSWLLAAAYVPGNGIKARLHHPMVLAVKAWALAHLLANGNLAHMVLFGSFLVWAAFSFSAARRRDRVGAVRYAPGRMMPTVITFVVGTLAWAGFAMWLHGWWIGIRVMG